MATIVTRAGKGSPLTNTEVDSNFTNLNNDKLETSGGSITGDLSFGDNDKAIFGAGSDLQIYHDGSNSLVHDNGAGRLVLKTNGDEVNINTGENEYMARFARNGAASLYYDNSPKLATTSTGIDVTGTVTADGLTVSTATGSSSVTPTDIIIKTETNASDWSTTNEWGRLVFYSDDISNGGAKPHATIGTSATAAGGGLSNLVFKTSNSTPSLVKRMDINEGGDISFYEDTGTTAKFFWDASAESLGIGTSSLSKKLTVIDDSSQKDTLDMTYQIVAGMSHTSIVGAGEGGGIGFMGPYNGTIATLYGAISGEKENGTSGDSKGVLRFGVRRSSAGANMEAMRIDSSGNVGIGTSSPTNQLTFGATTTIISPDTADASDSKRIRLCGGGTATVSRGSYINVYGNEYSGSEGELSLVAGNAAAGNILFYTGNASERMRITSSGNVGIGTSSPSYRLDVNSSSTTDSVVLAQFIALASNGLTIRRYNVGADNDRTGLYFQNEGVINTRLWVDDTGDVRVSGSTPTSDTAGTVVGTQTFTGTHIYKTDETDLEIGEAVCLAGKKIVRSSSAKSKTVVGIYAGESWKIVDSFGDKCRDSDGQPVNGAGHAVIALGDTRFFQSGSRSVGVLVDGPVQAGDLLCTSSVPGRLTVQDDDLMHSYTVAKAMEDGDGTTPVYAYVYSG